MSLIKIFVNDIELDFVKETLSIKKENTALTRDFKVAHSTFPFLIIENLAAKQALGTRALASINKIKTVEVTIFEGGKKYLGELQILSYLNGFRKCNLKYASELLSIMNKKIGEFMPIVSVIPGETSPEPFTEKSLMSVAGSENWPAYAESFVGKVFPEVKWQFPTMKYVNKFGKDLAPDDPWFLYENSVNKFLEGDFINNTMTIVGNVCTVENKNVPSPQVFLLSPLALILESIGWIAIGDFINSNFVKRLLLYSDKNNISESFPLKESSSVVFSPLTLSSVYDEYDHLLYNFYYSFIYIPATSAGVYYFEYEVTEPAYSPVEDSIPDKMFQIFLYNEPIYTIYNHLPNSGSNTYKGTVKIDVSEAQVGTNIFVRYFSSENILPSFSISKKVTFPNVYKQMHPTIQLSRYVPDWTFATYLNALQNLFNLEIDFDDFKKQLKINFNEDKIVLGEKIALKKSLQITSYEQTQFDAFLLKYENDEDPSLWITKSGSEVYALQKSNFLENLSTKFKFIPSIGTAELSEELDSKQGVGLMIYDTFSPPYISSNYLNQNLTIPNIYDVYWKKWLKFRLNASSVEMSGPFTETELNKIIDLKRIFIDNQEYIIQDVQYSETLQDNFEVKFNLLSINF